MPRKKCCRNIDQIPQARIFNPCHKQSCCSKSYKTLEHDEWEAIRLADYEKLYQEEAAKKMNISRQTFGRILTSAHEKIADALINGKSIKIDIQNNIENLNNNNHGKNSCSNN